MKNRAPFLAAFFAGLAAHGYAFSNKLINHDDIESLFGKGATITSGRWGLELVKILFPDWSMPWIYGILSLLLISAAACLMLQILDIRRPGLRLLTAALVTTFPSLTGNFCFMFTSAPYAWSFFLAVLAVRLHLDGRRVLAPLVLVLALGIYQAYIAVTASLFVLTMLAQALDGEKPVREIVFGGLRALGMMLFAVALYYGVTLLVLHFTGESFNTYVTDNVNGSVTLLRRIRIAYDAFFYVFSFRNFYLITSETLRYIHIVLALLLLACMAALALRTRSWLHIALLAFLTLLLPLAICCMFLIMSQQSIHTLVMYSFVAVYLLTALVLERVTPPSSPAVRALMSCLLALIAAGNIYFANMTYLKMQLQYENAHAFYTVLLTQVMQTPGFNENSRLAFLGEQSNLLHRFDELDTELLQGPNRDLVNIYSRENFLRLYLGCDLPFADEESLDTLREDPRVQAMPEYPYAGSVAKIDDFIVVKLG
ncbi:MAG: glucosyltransferase domain-containing protein [Oscillospiraceae bacterium]|nr:glucosyltransferase domain-containing protein [Oscillospiraceae bacterium]